MRLLVISLAIGAAFSQGIPFPGPGRAPTVVPTPNIGPVDAFIDMIGTATGTTVTTGNLATGTIGIGNVSGWALSAAGVGLTFQAHQTNCTLLGTPIVNGTTYATSHTSQSFALADSQSFSQARLTLNAGYKSVTVAGCLVIGPAQVAQGLAVIFDMVAVSDFTGNGAAAQLNNGGCGGAAVYGWNIEQAPGAVHSTCIPLTPGNTYWYSFHVDLEAGTTSLSMYDLPSGTQTGTTVTGAVTTGGQVQLVHLGNGEVGVSTGSTYFENTLVSFSGGGAHPIGPSNTTQRTVYLVNKSVNNGASATTTIASAAAPLATGNLSLVFISGETATRTVTGCTDTAGNTYVTDSSLRASLASNAAIEAWYAKNTIANAANVVTCTWSGTQDFRTIQALQIAGASTSAPFDVGANGTAAGGNATATTGSFTPTVATGSAFVGMHMTSGSTMVAGTNYSTIMSSTNSYSSAMRGPTAASSQTASMSSSSTNSKVIVVANIKP